MISDDELKRISEGTRWEVLAEERAAALLKEMKRTMVIGHPMERYIERIRFVAGDRGSDDALFVIEGSNVAAFGIHMTYPDSRETVPDYPPAWPLETVESVAAFLREADE